jgi:hypothetical protein
MTSEEQAAKYLLTQIARKLGDLAKDLMELESYIERLIDLADSVDKDNTV